MTSDPVKHILSQFGKRQMTMTHQSLAERLEEKTALSKLEEICSEIYDTWDKDQRPGKLLLALAGLLPNYRQDVDDVRSALRSRDSVIEDCARIADSYSRGEDNFAECACRIRELAQAPAPEGPKIVSARLIPWEPGMQGVDLTLSDGLRVALPLTAALSSHAETAGGVPTGVEAVLSFLDELAENAKSGNRKPLNPIAIGGSAKLYAEGLRAMIKAAKGGEK